MRVTASLVAVMAISLLGVQAARAQSVDKPQSAAAATAKTPSTAKASTAQARPATPGANARGSNAGKAKIEGVSTLRSTPADSKKDGGCSHSMADDA
jgi:hypothetical protein